MHFKLLTRGAALLLGMFLSLMPLAAWAAPATDLPTGVVNTGRLNVRSGPGVAFPILTRVDQGETLALLARNGNATWVNVRLSDNREGWVNDSYLLADVLFSSLPVSGANPVPPAATGRVITAQLELRSGPGTQNVVLAVLGQGQAVTLLGRTADSAWLKVQAGAFGDGWVAAQVIVRLPGSESGVATPTIQTSFSLASLPVLTGTLGVGPAMPGAPRVSLSSGSARTGSPIYIVVQGFPPQTSIAAVLTSSRVPNGFVVATAATDVAGAAQLIFRMPDRWPSGAAIAESHLSLAVGTTDGAVLIWNGLAYQP